MGEGEGKIKYWNLIEIFGIPVFRAWPKIFWRKGVNGQYMMLMMMQVN